MKDEDKTKAELIKELKTIRKEREKGVFKNIAEHKEANKWLEDLEGKYQKLFVNMMDGLVLHKLITDKNGHPVDYIIEKINKAVEKILSWNREDIEGKKATEVYNGDIPFIERYAKVAQTGKAEYFIDYYPRFKKWYEITSFCPERGYFANIFRDITERKQTEEKLKDSEEYLKILFDYAPDAYYISDLKGTFIEGNIAAERLVGYKKEELVGKNFLKLKLLSFNDMPKAAKALIKNVLGQPTGPDEFRLIRRDGIKVIVEISTYPVKIKEKTLALGIARDITQRKEAEKVLAESEEKYRTLLTNINDLVMEMDSEGKFTYISPQIFEMFGYTQEESIGLNAMDFVHPDDIEKCMKAMENIDKVKHFEYRSKHKDGHYVHVSTSGRYIPDSTGGFKIVSVLRDITERKQSENTIKLQLAEITNYYKNIPIGLAVLDCDLRFLKINDIFAQINSIPAEEHINKTFMEIVPDLELQALEITAEILRTGEPVKNIEFTGETLADPGIKHVWMEGWYPFKDDLGKITGFSVIVQDITAEKEADRMKTEFISTVSHELRTPLSITREGISLVLDKIPGKINKKQGKILTIAKNNIDRLARITNSLLDISKIEAGKIELKKERLNVKSLIEQVASSFQPKAKEKGLELKVSLPQEEIEVYAEGDKIIKIFINLLGNALKFTEKGYIGVSAKELEDEIEFTVKDTGKGISKDDLPKLFDKFQQFGRVDSEGEKGTGLGLSISKGIVTAHHGKLWVESTLGRGSKFIFTLPKYIATKTLFHKRIK